MQFRLSSSKVKVISKFKLMFVPQIRILDEERGVLSELEF